MSILHLAPYYPSVNAIHAGGVCMGKEIEELEKIDDVISISFVQQKYDYHLYSKENKNNFIGINLSKGEKIKNVLMHLCMPFVFSARYSNKCKKEIAKVLNDNNISAVHAEFTAMGQYFKMIKKYDSEIDISLVLHDVTIQSYDRKVSNTKNILKKLINRWQRKLVYKCEKKWIDIANNIMVFCDKDKKIIQEYYGVDEKKIRVINTYFELEKKAERLKNYHRIADGSTNYFFYGQLSRQENKEAAIRAIQIFNEYSKENTKSKLYIIGNAPDEEIKSYTTDNIICTGFVEDVDKFIIENCDIALFPLYSGAGIKVKVLHCMALGIPVVTGIVGAEGIDEEGKYIFLKEKNDEYISCMNQLSNLNDMEEIKNKSISFIKTKFDWEITVETLKEIYS